VYDIYNEIPIKHKKLLSHCHLTENAGNALKISRDVPKSPTETRNNQLLYMMH
jgi:hypothetical protein